jgi:hypothetical protein
MAMNIRTALERIPTVVNEAIADAIVWWLRVLVGSSDVPRVEEPGIDAG